MRNIIMSSVFLAAGLYPLPTSAWSCANGTCSGFGWAGTGASHFTGAGDDYPDYVNQPPVIVIVPPAAPRPVYPRGYDQETGTCYDLDAC